nr:MAG TPA: Protein of unknown function (DUF1559) [Caudoviricetes sp.]
MDSPRQAARRVRCGSSLLRLYHSSIIYSHQWDGVPKIYRIIVMIW